MKLDRLKQGFVLLLIATSVLVLIGCNTTPPTVTQTPVPDVSGEPPEIHVHEYKNEGPIEFRYSTDWTVIVPQLGLLATGPSNVVIGDDAGPLVTVLRIPVIKVHGNLEGEFNHYLDFGPKRDGYTTVKDSFDLEINGRPAKRIRMSYDGNDEDHVAQEAIIVGIEAESGVVYIVSATAPPSDWEDNQILFNLLIQSIKIKE